MYTNFSPASPYAWAGGKEVNIDEIGTKGSPGGPYRRAAWQGAPIKVLQAKESI